MINRSNPRLDVRKITKNTRVVHRGEKTVAERRENGAREDAKDGLRRAGRGWHLRFSLRRERRKKSVHAVTVSERGPEL